MNDILQVFAAVLGMYASVYLFAFAVGWLLAVFKTTADLE